MREGQVSVHSENIFPVIKQWLYSDRDIFLRELVANAQDALQKLDRLEVMGEFEREGEEIGVVITWDEDQRVLEVKDDGIGMTLEEIDRYINDIAFSGALDFVHQYEEEGEMGDGIIGHFGLGFYSVFMVADRVTIDSLSYVKDAEPAHWESEDGLHYTMGLAEEDDEHRRVSHGTTVRLHISDDEIDYAAIEAMLKKYCYFMKKPIYLKEAGAEDGVNARDGEGTEDAESAEDAAQEAPKPINNTRPLWLSSPSELKDEDYIAFYHECFEDLRDPMFWIHLNMDYPYRLKGILYFPQREMQIENLDGRIKLYCNQVFVTDGLRDLIPEFLFLLKGALDCPDLPLNVSRSYLQNDQVLGRLSDHIVRKVADKLKELEKNDRAFYEESWPALERFARYGYLTDEKFAERIEDVLLFKELDEGYLKPSDFDDEVYYTNDPTQQMAYVKRLKAQGAQVIEMSELMDQAVMQKLSLGHSGKPAFYRVDAKLDGEKGEAEAEEAFRNFFRKLSENESLEVELRSLGDDLPAYLLEDEQSRSAREFQEQFLTLHPDMEQFVMPKQESLILNADHIFIHELEKKLPQEGEEADPKLEAFGMELLDLARLAKGELQSEELLAFLHRTSGYLAKLL